MKVISIDLPQCLTNLNITVASDWHIGDKSCKLSEIKNIIEKVKKSENEYMILNGDLMNNATKNSVSDSYAETIPPMQQINMLVDLLSPVKDKILFVTCGNHEARTYRESGVDLMSIFCSQMGLQERYAREGGVLYVAFGESTGNTHHRRVAYSFYITHGTGGGRKEGAKAIRLADMASIVDVDIYIHSHTHLPFVMKEDFYRSCYNNRSVAKVSHLFVNSSAQLDYGGYGQTNEFKPASCDNPIIHLSGSIKRATATL